MFLIFCLLSGLSACLNFSSNPLRNEVSGKGRLELSSINSFLAPNRFLSEEADKSETLKGFLSVQGAPSEIEFEDSIFMAPKLFLHYKEKNEFYTLRNVSKDWIISGPFKSEEETLNDGHAGSLFNSGSPLVQDTKIDLSGLGEKSPDKTMPTNLNSGKGSEAIKDDDKSDRAPSGSQFQDIYHLVKNDGETFEFIAYWYTEDISNHERIKSINSGLSTGTVIKQGSSIRIPAYLLKRREAPSAEDLRKFIMTR